MNDLDYTVKRLSTADFEEYIDFIDLVFSAAHAPHNFRSSLPKLYQSGEEHMRCHYAAIVNGRIRAAVGSYPMTLYIAGEPIKVAGIGAVATHRDYEGRGLMKALMNVALDDMVSEGVQLSPLGGRRLRYGYYGYEKCGVSYRAELHASSVASLLKETPECIFAEVQPNDIEYLRFIDSLSRSQPWYVERPLTMLHQVLTSWHARPFVALRDGVLLGYFIASSDLKRISELFVVGDSPELYNGILRCFMARYEGDLALSIPAWKPSYLHEVARYAEDIQIQHNCNWRIFDFAGISQALMEIKGVTNDLLEGSAVIDIEGYGSLVIEVSTGTVNCAKSNAVPDLALDTRSAMRLIFGNLPPESVYRGPKLPLFASWFPLPLCCLSADEV